jgi:hypothetical protein
VEEDEDDEEEDAAACNLRVVWTSYVVWRPSIVY